MIPVIEILRLEENSRFGTFGVLKLNKRFFCVTLEPPDNENEQMISSIPAQQYICERNISPRFGETFEIKNVPGRSHVLFHKGNIADNTKGCVILAKFVGNLGIDRAVLNSGETFKLFIETLKQYETFHLTISEHY